MKKHISSDCLQKLLEMFSAQYPYGDSSELAAFMFNHGFELGVGFASAPSPADAVIRDLERYCVTVYNMVSPSERRKIIILAPSQDDAERLAVSGGLVNLQSGWGVLGSYKVPTRADVKDFFFIPKEDRGDLVDSLLLDSGQEVLSGTVGDVRVSVVVCGEIRVFWNGDVWKTPSSFPEDLREAIRQAHSRGDAYPEVSNNNWFESRIWRGDKLLEEDVVDDLAGLDDDGAKDFVLDLVSDWLDPFGNGQTPEII